MKTLTETIRKMGLQEQDPALDPKNDGEYNDEGGMAITQLKTARDAVDELMTIIKDDDNLPEWVQSKLTKAVDYMDSVRDYLSAEFKESRAARDARRDAAKDPDMKSKGFDKDNVASADDVAKAGKNIIVQLKKASDVKGNKEIEFADGKKKKIKPDVIDKLLKIFMQIKKPRDKEKFQAMIAKSERDMMNIAKKLGAQYNVEENESVQEETDMNEAMDQKKFASAEKELVKYAMKDGGIDKKDFLAVAKMLGQIGRINILQAGQVLTQLNKKLKGMDTDPRDKVYEILKGQGLMEMIEALDKDDEPKIKEIIKKLKGASQAHAGQAKDLEKAVNEDYYTVVYYDEKGRADGEKNFKDKKKADAMAAKGNSINKLGGKSGYKVFKVKGKMEEVEMEENFSPKEIKMAIGIASDKRYAGGNMTGAVKAIEKIKKGLSKHKQVAAVLQRQNEDVDYDQMFEEAFMNLDDTIRSIVLGEAQSGDKEAYQKFFKAAMKKFGIKSPGELSGDKEKEFYNYIDKNWKGDNEKAEGAHEDGEGDHAEVGKSGKKMKIKVDPEIEEAVAIVAEDYDISDLTEEQLDELIGKIAKGLGKVAKKAGSAAVSGVKKVANRMSTSGRADAADKKAASLEKKKADRERLQRAKERLQKAKDNLNNSFFKEAEMTDAQMKKREEIVKELKKKEADFKERYGDRAKEVMYATATKMAMKS